MDPCGNEYKKNLFLKKARRETGLQSFFSQGLLSTPERSSPSERRNRWHDVFTKTTSIWHRGWAPTGLVRALVKDATSEVLCRHRKGIGELGPRRGRANCRWPTCKAPLSHLNGRVYGSLMSSPSEPPQIAVSWGCTRSRTAPWRFRWSGCDSVDDVIRALS